MKIILKIRHLQPASQLQFQGDVTPSSGLLRYYMYMVHRHEAKYNLKNKPCTVYEQHSVQPHIGLGIWGLGLML